MKDRQDYNEILYGVDMDKVECKMADVLTGAPIGIIQLLADKNHLWTLKIGPMLRRNNILAKNMKSEELRRRNRSNVGATHESKDEKATKSVIIVTCT